jgi:hypothetical protein
MPQSNITKFEAFSEALSKGVHQCHAAGHQLEVYLTNNAPSAASHAVLADLAGITEQNGYASADIQNDISRTGGVTSVVTKDYHEWTASGGSFGPFRYAVVKNATASGQPLIGYFDYGSAITVNTGEKFKVDFGTSLFTVT